MVRKLVSTVFAAMLLLSLGMQVSATEADGSIRVSLDLGELPAINGSLTLYQVGTPVTDGYRIAEGLYMVVQQERIDGFHVIEPFLVLLARDGAWNVQIDLEPAPIIAENPQTGQPVTPLLGAMGMAVSGVGLYLCADSKRRK